MKSKSWDGDDRELGPLGKLHDGKEKGERRKEKGETSFCSCKVFDASEEQESPTQKVGFDKKIPKGLMKESENKRAPRKQRGVRADTTLGLCWDQLQVFADHRITFLPTALVILSLKPTLPTLTSLNLKAIKDDTSRNWRNFRSIH